MTLFLLLSTLTPAAAESWCAAELIVHEWGVQVFRHDGAALAETPIPPWFHRQANPSRTSPLAKVRHLPADGGERELPVVQFYAGQSMGTTIPVALEVGFTQGAASVWYPAVDHFIPAAQAHDPASHIAHKALVTAREQPATFGEPQTTRLGADPTMQLGWEALVLSPTTSAIPHAATIPWVNALRSNGDALWVSNGQEHERFVFYEGATTEASAVRIVKGETWTAKKSHYKLVNDSDWTVHDVFFAHRGHVFYAPAIPPGKGAGFVLQDHSDPSPLTTLRDRIQEADGLQLDAVPWSTDCPMMRNPAKPATTSVGHRMYQAEVDLLLNVWGDRFFQNNVPTLLYREDAAALEALMPLAVYTDMYHVPKLWRLGLVLVEGVVVPE